MQYCVVLSTSFNFLPLRDVNTDVCCCYMSVINAASTLLITITGKVPALLAEMFRTSRSTWFQRTWKGSRGPAQPPAVHDVFQLQDSETSSSLLGIQTVDGSSARPPGGPDFWSEAAGKTESWTTTPWSSGCSPLHGSPPLSSLSSSRQETGAEEQPG